MELSPILFAMSINDISKKLSVVDSDRDINILLYADDLVILAESREMLQKKLDVLCTYCSDNNLKVNINKSKVIAFNSRKHIDMLLYNGCILQEIVNFKYLGMTFNRTVNLKYSQKALVQQSMKARAVLEGYLRKHKHMPVNVIFDLFDTLIKPILLYACEVWGITMGNDIEKLHLSFMTLFRLCDKNLFKLSYENVHLFVTTLCQLFVSTLFQVVTKIGTKLEQL